MAPAIGLEASAEAMPPRLAGGALTLRAMRLGTTFGTPGSELEIVLEFETVVPGFSSVELQMAGESLGDPVEVHTEAVAVTRTVPDLAPGVYSLLVMHDGLVMDEAEFRVLRTSGAPGGEGPAPMLIGAGLVVVLTGAAVWRRRARSATTSAR